MQRVHAAHRAIGVGALLEQEHRERVLAVHDRKRQHVGAVRTQVVDVDARDDQRLRGRNVTVPRRLGFAMEHFDAIGRWRETDGGAAINATIELDGATIDSLRGFREALLSQGDEFVRTVTDKLLTYALGRGVDYYDAPTVRRLVRQLKQDDYRWSSLVQGIVASEPFQKRRVPVDPTTVVAGQ